MWTGKPEPWYATGFAHGISGVAYFLLRLWEATGEGRWRELAREVIDTLDRFARPDHGGLNWSPNLGADELDRCQWCHGSPGLGLLYVKAYEILKEAAHLKTAEAAGEATSRTATCAGARRQYPLFLNELPAHSCRDWEPNIKRVPEVRRD